MSAPTIVLMILLNQKFRSGSQLIPVTIRIAILSFFICASAVGFSQSQRIILPEGRFYHGVYPGGPIDDENSGNEDLIRCEDIKSYVNTVGRNVAWVYFSTNWFKKSDVSFPWEKTCCINRAGAIPFIRLMLRPDTDKIKTRAKIDAYFANLERLNRGEVDQALQAWGRAAHDFGHPLIVEFGTEVNDKTHAWNGYWNARQFDRRHIDFTYGPQEFQRAYRRIISQIRLGGATNITWVFHVTSSDDPSDDWNRLEAYYPGEVIDWVGVSVYGAQTPKKESDEDDNCPPFDTQFDSVYRRIQTLAPDKPVFVLEFGQTSGHPFAARRETKWQRCKQDMWAHLAFQSIFTTQKWTMLRGFSWWNEKWDENGISNMRLQDSPSLAGVFRHFLTDEPYKNLIIDRPILQDNGNAGASNECSRRSCSVACNNP